MQSLDIDRNVKYLALTLGIVVLMAAGHNLTVEDTTYSFAMCDTTTVCQGAEVSDYCIGIEMNQVSCVNPENASEYRRAEAECGLDAQAICNENPDMQGLDWTGHENATYQGRSCSDWADSDERIDLLKCEDTFDDITRWNQ